MLSFINPDFHSSSVEIICVSICPTTLVTCALPVQQPARQQPAGVGRDLTAFTLVECTQFQHFRVLEYFWILWDGKTAQQHLQLLSYYCTFYGIVLDSTLLWQIKM